MGEREAADSSSQKSLPQVRTICQLQSLTITISPAVPRNKKHYQRDCNVYTGTPPLHTLEDTPADKTIEKCADGILSHPAPSLRTPHPFKARSISIPTAGGERTTLAVHDKATRHVHAGTGQA